VNFLAFSPDGTHLGVSWQGGHVSLLDARTGQERFALFTPPVAHIGLAFSHDGKWLAVGASDCTVRLWNTATGRLGSPQHGHTGWPRRGAFSPDGKRLVTGGELPDRDLRLWTVGSLQPPTLLKGHKDQIYLVAFSPDGSRITSTSLDSTARLWDGT